MKTTSTIIAFSTLFISGAAAQLGPPVTGEQPYTVSEQGPHHKVWQRVTWITNAFNDTLMPWTNSYTELKTGMSRRVGGRWVASDEQIHITATGAQATNAQHSVVFAGNINAAGAVSLTTPEGKRLISNILGLSYWDPSTTNSVFIAEIKDAVGELLPSGNEALFPDAFSGCLADVLYVNSVSRFEQLILLREQLPSPTEWYMNPDTTMLQVITEFLEAPEPGSTPAPDGSDEQLDFGIMQMGRGEAFAVGSETNRIPVVKRWLLLDGRHCLVEQVPFRAVQPLLGGLPAAHPHTGSLTPVPGSVLNRLATHRLLPDRKLVRADTPAFQLAQSGLQGNSFALDYTLLTSQTNYTFQGDMTYYVSGAVTLSGTNNVVEGGTVIKFTNSTTAGIVAASLKWSTDMYRPAVFTSKNDNTVGEGINGSTGNPNTNFCGGIALDLSGAANPIVSNARFSYLNTAVAAANVALANVQIVNCWNGFSAPGTYKQPSLKNVLIYRVNNFFPNSGVTNALIAQNVTAHYVTNFMGDGDGVRRICLTNCLFVCVTNWQCTSSFVNSSRFLDSDANVFQAVGAGLHYLPTNSSYRAAGTINIDPTLLTEIWKRTTWAPLMCSNILFTSSTNWVSAVAREVGAPSIGYCYTPLDYLASQVSINSGVSFSLTNGLAVGMFGASAFKLPGYISGFVSAGRPDALNRLVWYPAVQEQSVALNGFGPSTSQVFDFSPSPNGPRSVQLRFTDFAMQGLRQSIANFPDTYSVTMTLKDCRLRGAGLSITPIQFTAPYASSAILQNNLCERATVSVYNGYVINSTTQNPAYLTLYNNLFKQSTLALTYNDYYATAHPAWYVQDNLFDASSITMAGDGNYLNYISRTNNAFTAGTVNPLDGTGNLTNVLADYQSCPTGDYFYPSTGTNLARLIDAGSRSAPAAGLYHYTTLTNQTKEAVSIVDIGFHYVAVGTNGLPVDTNGDGISDVVSDANGDGLTETNEIPWNLWISTQPQNKTAVRGQNVAFSVGPAGIGPFGYQWRFGGTNISGATASSYVIVVVATADAGNYSVIVTNGTAMMASSNALLTVLIPLTITNFYPYSQGCIQGSNASFHVQVDGTAPSYQWWHGSSPLTNSTHISGANAADLTLFNVTTNDAGSYFTVVTNLAGSVQSDTGILTVSSPINLGPLQVSPSPVVQAADTSFAVTTSDPYADYQWQFQTTNIPGAKATNYSRFVMQPAQDSGLYSIIGSNLAGVVTASTNVTVLIPPLITAQPTNVLANAGATVAFTVTVSTNSAMPLTYLWYYYDTNFISWATNFLPSLTLTNVQSTNIGLYSVLVTNQAGTNWSVIASLALNGQPCPACTNADGTTNVLQLPYVSMIQPTNSFTTNAAVYPYGPAVALRATASTTDRSSYITQVAFYGGTNLNLTDTNLLGTAIVGANTTFALRYQPPLGTNWARAVAWDNKGRSNVSHEVYYIMNQAPLVTTKPQTITLVWEGYSTNAWFTNYVSDDGYPYHLTNIYWGPLGGVASVVSYTNYTASNIVVSSMATFTNYGQYTLELDASDGNASGAGTCGVTIRHRPTVSITSPTTNAVIVLTNAIALDATASAYGGRVTNVEFYTTSANGTNDIGPAMRSIGSTFALRWTNAPLLTNSITAVATDNNGLSTTSSPPVNILVVPPLYVWMNSPTNGQILPFSPTNVLLSATPVSYISGGIATMNFSNGSTYLGQGVGQPDSTYQFLWQDVTNGVYTVVAQASDSFNNTATNSVTFTVNAMPTVSIITPTNTQHFWEVTNILLQAVASDSDGSVAQVQFFAFPFASTNLIGLTNSPGTNGVYSVIWSNREDQTYSISAVAIDNEGAATISDIKVFYVQPTNPPPLVAITFPTNGATFREGSDITILADATNAVNGGVVTNVAFFVGTDLLGNDPNVPYSITRCCWSAGTYVLTATATDAYGGNSNSLPVVINIIPAAPTAGGGFWDPIFGNPGVDGAVYTMKADGTNIYFAGGPSFFVGDMSIYSIAKWDGSSWSDMGRSSTLSIYAFAFALDGTNLYAGGQVQPGDLRNICQWDGTNWTQSGSNVLKYANGQPAIVHAIALLGSELYVGGDFVSADSDTNVEYVAHLNRSTLLWEQVGNGLSGPVQALATIDGRLFAAGSFTNAGGNSNANLIAELVGTNWTNLGTGLAGTNALGNPSAAYCLAACDQNLFVGGDFVSAGGNTNANGIARWDGKQWTAIAGGLVSGAASYPPSLIVSSISVQGKTLFAGGQFSGTWQGTNQLGASLIAEAVWSERDQTWTWSSLDEGLFAFGNGWVDTIAFVTGSMPNSYDLYVGGLFNFAGSEGTASKSIARWSVGRAYPTNAPAISVISPANNATFTDPSSITFIASVIPGTATVSHVEFFIDATNDLGSPYSPNNLYTNSWTSPSPGPHLVTAIVNYQNNSKRSSTPVAFQVNSSTNAVVAVNDSFTVLANSPPNYLPVLTNDTPANGLNISDAGFSFATPLNSFAIGTPGVSFDRKFLVYTPFSNAFGTNILYYTATNGAGVSAQAFVTVKVAAQPQVQITYPSDGSVSNAPASLTIAGTAIDYDGTVAGVQLFANGVAYGSPVVTTTSNTFTASWNATVPGFYTFTAVATDNDGLTNASSQVTLEVRNSSVTNHLPVAAITAPIPPLTNLDRLILTNAVVVRTGQLALSGSAYDLDGDPVSYQLLLMDPNNLSGLPLYNVTPAPLNSQGFHALTTGITNGSLGSVDLTLVENGAYILTLLVRGGGDETNATLLINVDSNLKIGQFSFSEQDIVIPVNGIPLTVTRTYSSLNPRSADFGYSWTYGIMGMDVQLDEERFPVIIGTERAPFADVEEDDHGNPLATSVRIGGGRDVTLTLPDGRRSTFAFTPRVGDFHAYAQWTPPPDVHALLTNYVPGSDVIQYSAALHWQESDSTYGPSTFDNHDFPGWILQTQDGTKYYITRGSPNTICFDSTGHGNFITVQACGSPQLTSIVQRSGDTITIDPAGIKHFAPNNTSTPTRSALFDRDSQGRIVAIWDPNSLSNSPASVYPAVRYVYHADTGNLLQVLKIADRNAGTYATNFYNYDNPAFPHYITSIVNPLGVPVARNYYDDSGRLTAVVDANGNTNQFIHNLTNDVEVMIDRRGYTNSYVYDPRGNIIFTTNAVGGISQMNYDVNNNKTNQVDFLNGLPYATNNYNYDLTAGFLLSSVNPLGYSNVFTYNANGQVLTTTDARGCTSTNYYDPTTGNILGTSDALGNSTTNFYDAGTGLLLSSINPVGTITANVYDSWGNLTGSAVLQAGTLTVLSTNSFSYDAEGNQIASVVWRKVGSQWTGATNISIYDAQNRVVQTIDANGGTNTVIYDPTGRQQAIIDPLGHTGSYAYDFLGRLIWTTNADLSTTGATYDSNGNRSSSIDQLGNVTQYQYDALGRQTNTIAPDLTQNFTFYDDLGRVRFSVDARNVTNAFGYDVAGRRTAVTNALGMTPPVTNGFTFDPNGNQVYFTDTLGRITTSVFDRLNRTVQVVYPDGTSTFTGYDSAGRRVAETNQDTVVTRFGYDGAGRLTAVTNAFGVGGQQMVTQFQYDEAGNETAQVDALNRTNSFAYDALNRRTSRSLPGGQSESFGYDAVGNLLSHTDFNGLLLTNQYTSLNGLWKRWNGASLLEAYSYNLAGQLTNRTDSSGSYAWVFDLRGRVTTNSTPFGVLYYAYDANGNLTNLSSATASGISVAYQYDALNRMTNAVDKRLTGTQNTTYCFDGVGNLQALRYPNGVTNYYQYDTLNRLTNLTWKLNGAQRGDFGYVLGATGARTGLSDNVGGTNRTFAWSYDRLYRLTNETVGVSAPTGTLTNWYDGVGNRTNRTGSLGVVGPANNSFDVNDWVDSDAVTNNANPNFDANGNTRTNGSSYYAYDWANRLISYTNGSSWVTMAYDADGNRVRKATSTTTNLYLVAMVNPSGYAQVVEEFTVSGVTTNLAKVYAFGLALMSQRLPGTSTNFFGHDGHGSTRFLLDPAGGISDSYAYDAFGNLIVSNGTPATAYLYCGEQWDTSLGFYYLRARYYRPDTGRFWTMDTFPGDIRDPLSLHKYLYCRSNPLGHSDPSGHDIMDVGTLMAMQMELNLGLPYASALYEATATPDFTKAVEATLREIEQSFLAASVSDQERKAMINEVSGAKGLDRAFASFDIIELNYPSASHSPHSHHFVYNPPGIKYGPPPENPTVGFMGKCYYANAVNYAMFGLMFRLAADFYHDDRTYSADNAVVVVRALNAFLYQVGPGNLNYDEKEEFTRFGYDRSHAAPEGRSNPGAHIVSDGAPTGPLHWVWEPTFPRHNPYPGQQ